MHWTPHKDTRFMRIPGDIGIFAAGAVSPLGLTVQRHAAVAAIDGSGVLLGEMVLRDGSVLRSGFLDLAVLPPLAPGVGEGVPRPSPHYRRLLRLAHPALAEVTRRMARAMPLFVAVPQSDDSVQLPDFATRFLKDLHGQCGGAFDFGASQLTACGRAGFFSVLAQAAAYAEAHTCFVLAGAIDSYCDLRLLAWLDSQGRLMRDGFLEAFSPSEGAGFVCIGPQRLSCDTRRPWARLAAWGRGQEPGHRLADLPNDASGLTAAVQAAIEDGLEGHTHVGTLYPTLVGDHTTAIEWFTTCMRLRARIVAEPHTMSCASANDDPGVAFAAIQLAVAAVQLQQQVACAPALIWSTDDRAERSACLLDAAPPTALLPDDQSMLDQAQDPVIAHAWYGINTDSRLDEAAGFYTTWRSAAAVAHVQRVTSMRYEARLMRALTFLTQDNQAVGWGLPRIARNTAGYGYVVLRLALCGRVWPVVRQVMAAIEDKQMADALFDAEDWDGLDAHNARHPRDAGGQEDVDDRRGQDAADVPALPGLTLDASYAAAIADAWVHAWQPSLAAPFLAWLQAKAARFEIFAAVARRTGWQAARPALLTRLSCPTRPQREAAQALASMAHPSDVQVLLDHTSHPQACVRRAAAVGLVRIGARAAVLQDDAGFGLGPWRFVLAGGAPHYAALEAAITATPSASGILALGAFGCLKAIDTLVQLADSQRHARAARGALFLLTGVVYTDLAAWQAWHRDVRCTLDDSRRYRLGVLYGPAVLQHMVHDAAATWPLRHLAALELDVRFGINTRFDVWQWPGARPPAPAVPHASGGPDAVARLGSWGFMAP